MVAGITGLMLPAGGLLGSDISTALSEIEGYLVRRMAGFCSVRTDRFLASTRSKGDAIIG